MSEVQRVSVFDRLESVELTLAKNLVGKTLLGEIILGQEQCGQIASALSVLVRKLGAARALTMTVEMWPLVLAVWLVNEAFFSFVSGAFWPNALAKLEINETNTGNYSVKLGRAFVALLERRGLPRFRRLNTRWSYLGPLLAHAGIPRSCLREFFDKVLPRAVEYGVVEREGYQELLHDLPRIYLTKPTERFLMFGEDVAMDFVRRCVELRSIWLSQGTVPDADVVRLPSRVVDAFKQWVQEPNRAPTAQHHRRHMRRPAVVLEPGQGVLLLLPAQLASLGPELAWQVETNAGDPLHVDASREPGADETLAGELLLSEPFSSLKVQFRSREESLGVWAFGGVSREAPFLFFDAESLKVLGQRAPASGEVGVVHPTEWTVRAVGQSASARVVADLGQLPLGWGDLTARVYDLSEAAELSLFDEAGSEVRSVELTEEATRPRLVPRVPGEQLVFLGSPPSLELCRPLHESEADFLKAWSIAITAGPDCDRHVETMARPLSNVELIRHDDSRWYRIDLSQDSLLGPDAWGEFELRARGPLGQDSVFRFLVVPPVQINYRAKEWLANPDRLRIQLQVSESVGVRGATPTSDPRTFEVVTQGEAVRVYFDAVGFQGRRFELPLDVQVPIPSWAVYDPEAGVPLLAWSRRPVRVSLREVEGRSPVLLAKLALPWAVPQNVKLVLRSGASELLSQMIQPDARGFARVDLAPAMAAARQSRTLRLDLILVFDGMELACAQVQRHWVPVDFAVCVDGDAAVFTWSEGVSVEHRAIEVTSLFAPWEPPRRLQVPGDVRDEWRIGLDNAASVAGRYRCVLGVEDPWSAEFEAGDDAVATFDRGCVDDWATTALFRDPGPNGYLYRLLLHHHTEAIGLSEEPSLEGADHSQLAGKLLRTELSLRGSRQTDLLRSRVSRLLYRLPGDALLAGIAALPEHFDPTLVLRAQLLNRPWRDVQRAAGADGAPDLNVEALWKAWRPLGLWAELHLMRADPDAAEERILRYLGREPLLELCPAQVGGQIAVWVDGQERLEGQLADLISAELLSPFEVSRLGSSVSLKLELKTEPGDSAAIIARDERGRWTVQALDERPLPETLIKLNTAGHDTAKVRCFYPRTNRPLHPEGQIVALVKSGNVTVMQTIQAHCSALPGSPIGPQAFQDACFDWCVQATADRQLRARLEELCTTLALSVAADLMDDPGKPTSASEWRVKNELRRRWIPNAYAEPLFAVHFLVWLVAMTLIWRGMRHATPLRISDDKLAEVAVELYGMAPRLMEHDLLKVGALEALELARTVRHDA